MTTLAEKPQRKTKDSSGEYQGKYLEMIGVRYGLLVVEGVGGKNEHNQRFMECVCDCGNKSTVRAYLLLQGKTKSCGCNKLKPMREACTKHGKKKTRLYRIWCNMKTRCYNPSSEYFHIYGGKEIFVCEEWLTDFQVFYDWAMANGYNDQRTIDRKDNSFGYSPDNCRWVGGKKQQNNRTNNVLVVYNGRRYTVAEICDEYGICKSSLYSRIRRGQEIERWLDESIGKRR